MKATATLLLAAGALITATGSLANTDPHADPGEAAQPVQTQPAETSPADAAEIDPKNLFAKNCTWCHAGFGMEQGKGPKLAGTTLSAKGVYNRIANGLSGAMPAYKKLLSEQEIQALTDYVKSLPAN